MDEESEPVRLEGERLRRRLHVVRARDAPYLGCEPLLVLVRVEMLDRRVREADVERVVVVLQVAAVPATHSMFDGRVVGALGNGQVEQHDARRNVDESPVRLRPSDVENARRTRRRELVDERFHPATTKSIRHEEQPLTKSFVHQVVSIRLGHRRLNDLPRPFPRPLEDRADILGFRPAPRAGPLHEEAMDDRPDEPPRQRQPVVRAKLST